MDAYFETSSTLAKSKIGALTSSIMASTSEVDELVSAIAAGSSELQDATAIREKEAADFAKNEAGLMDSIDLHDGDQHAKLHGYPSSLLLCMYYTGVLGIPV